MKQADRSKTVYIPVSYPGLARAPKLMHLVIEAQPGRAGAAPDFTPLLRYGFQAAITRALTVLKAVGLFPSTSPTRPGPVLYIANPVRDLSNSEGANFAVALGLLMYEHDWHIDRLIVTGCFNKQQSHLGTVEECPELEKKLAAGLLLGKQTSPLGFAVPATAEGQSIVTVYSELIEQLERNHIRIVPIKTLGEAISVCSEAEKAIS